MSDSATDRRDLVFVGDVHLDRDDPCLEAFLVFLDSLAATTRRLVLAGDLFNLWIGRSEFEQSHHRAVVDRLQALRRQGVVVRYIEGNRDYRIGPAYGGVALDDATDGGIVERFGGKRLFAIHGDLANPLDRQYRIWRRVSRTRLAWLLLLALPRERRVRFVEGLEDRLRRTNVDFRHAFPEAEVRAYGGQILGQGHDAVVLGHFHVERDLESRPPAPPGRILVLPEWKGSRRYLRVGATGEIRFEGVS